MKMVKKTNPILVALIDDLKAVTRENGTAIWRDVAIRLEKPRRNYAAVNVSKINRHTSPDDLVLVTGKVLGSGDIDHKVTVAALQFSEQAASKIKSAGGECLKIKELAEKHPKGSGIIILR
ncbi:MAG: 50S ribosomal protein L18e [Methanothrix sp.]|jgi:large subunit ribosomal protein L18e|uniref:Large ribosomal subunit protein eL18 n=1 Tax=Methanothrix harundinacea TaxID=301375 RepID=A0A101FW25_9EURY|nr:MAG: 50S ribosomal protein L18e [Methanosaeta sp. SDB]KUK45450.1 MAG: 50S ribosomal protein L18e [Methanothrix harundinacea]MDD2637795.1 50S ribosomal protein L18e [Methanothrix sp.]MDI9398256.1 50S ribosomal protein L18e [Euryarchaeota archaeon]KUK97199.1 MAG: 50S ribosomal protein L18e [Methanothrix harundinacea]